MANPWTETQFVHKDGYNERLIFYAGVHGMLANDDEIFILPPGCHVLQWGGKTIGTSVASATCQISKTALSQFSTFMLPGLIQRTVAVNNKSYFKFLSHFSKEKFRGNCPNRYIELKRKDIDKGSYGIWVTTVSVVKTYKNPWVFCTITTNEILEERIGTLKELLEFIIKNFNTTDFVLFCDTCSVISESENLNNFERVARLLEASLPERNDKGIRPNLSALDSGNNWYNSSYPHKYRENIEANSNNEDAYYQLEGFHGVGAVRASTKPFRKIVQSAKASGASLNNVGNASWIHGPRATGAIPPATGVGGLGWGSSSVSLPLGSSGSFDVPSHSWIQGPAASATGFGAEYAVGAPTGPAIGFGGSGWGSSSPFGAPAPPATGFGGFGAPAPPATGFGGFGAPAPPATGFGGFGAPASPGGMNFNNNVGGGRSRRHRKARRGTRRGTRRAMRRH